MSDDAVRDFVERYLPAYYAYLPGLYGAAASSGVGGKPTALLKLDQQRRPVDSRAFFPTQDGALAG
jgi:D-glycerate 3-kinase